jgi:hypothetical protein
MNGQPITQAELLDPTNLLSGLPSLFRQALQSLKSWWSGSDSSQTSVQVWTAAVAPGNSQTAGVVKPIRLATQARAAAAATRPTVRVAPAVTAAATPHTTRAMPRAWHSFAARSATR